MPSRTLAGSAALKGDWLLGEDNWKDEMDGNLLWLSVLVQGRFVDEVTTLPGSPTEGMVYILSAAATSNAKDIAVYDEAAWHYRTPLAGWRLFNTTLGVFSQFSGTAWVMDTAALSAEDVRDTIAAALVSGTNVTITPNDGADTITIAAAGGGSGITAEDAMDTIAAMLQPGSGVNLSYNDAADQLTVSVTGALLAANNLSDVASPATARNNLGIKEATFIVALSDEATAITAGAGKVTLHAPYNFTLEEVFAGLSTTSSSGAVTIDVNKAGASVFTTNPSIDATEETSLTGTAGVISGGTMAITKGDKLTFDIDAAGTGAKGLKIYLVGHR
jgi:hypothetical protein